MYASVVVCVDPIRCLVVRGQAAGLLAEQDNTGQDEYPEEREAGRGDLRRRRPTPQYHLQWRLFQFVMFSGII